MSKSNGAAAVGTSRKMTEFESVAVPEPSTHTENPEETGFAPAIETSKRRMPDNLRKYLLKVQGGKFYLPAAYRMVWFRDECPDWGVSTEITEGGQEAGFATVRAIVQSPDGRIIATGHKTETRQDFPAGWVEKAETGAVARALALAGFGTQFSPELDDEGYRPADSPQPIAGQWSGGGSFASRGERAGGYTRSGTQTRAAVDNQTESERAPTSAALPEVWEGPGQCPRCHAPAGKKHGRQCAAA